MTQAELMRLLERGTEGMPEASEAVSADAASTLDDMAPAFNWQPPVQDEPEAITPESGVPTGRKPLRAPVPTSAPVQVPRSDGTSALGREDLAEQPLSQAPVMPGVLGSQADDATRRNQGLPEDPIKAAGGRDRMNALLRSIELGGKQMSAGLGGGPVGELVTQRTDEEGKARALKAGEDMRAAAGARQGQADAFTKERIALADREGRARRDKTDADAAHRAQREGVTDAQFGERMKAIGENSKAMQSMARASLGLKGEELESAREERKGKADEKRETGVQEREVFDLDGKPHMAKTKAEAEKLRGAMSGAKTILDLLGEVRSDVQKNGLALWPGERKARLGAHLKNMQLMAKGSALYDLGVLAGPDMEMIEGAAGDPTKLQGLAGSAGVLASLNALEKTLRFKTANSLWGQEGGGAKPGAAPRKMKLPSGEIVEVE